jgi:hypothetical protein
MELTEIELEEKSLLAEELWNEFCNILEYNDLFFTLEKGQMIFRDKNTEEDVWEY